MTGEAYKQVSRCLVMVVVVVVVVVVGAEVGCL